jgi:hypothetical protein
MGFLWLGDLCTACYRGESVIRQVARANLANCHFGFFRHDRCRDFDKRSRIFLSHYRKSSPSMGFPGFMKICPERFVELIP